MIFNLVVILLLLQWAFLEGLTNPCWEDGNASWIPSLRDVTRLTTTAVASAHPPLQRRTVRWKWWVEASIGRNRWSMTPGCSCTYFTRTCSRRRSRMICHNYYWAERVREVPKEVQYLTLTNGRNSLREWKGMFKSHVFRWPANRSFFWLSREQYTTFEIYIVKLNGTVQIWVGSGFALQNEENGKGQSRE